MKLWVILLLNISFYCFLIFGLETKDAIYPKNIALEIPAAAAFIPPIKAPTKPLSFTSVMTPLARRFPKPVRGTVAPQPAKSTNF